MIDERQEELASLHALDLLERGERSRFEGEIASNPQLQVLVRDLRETVSHVASAVPRPLPPPGLKTRVLASLPPAPPEAQPVPRGQIEWFSLAPWALAASLALACVWLGLQWTSSRTHGELLRTQLALTETTLQGTRQQLEAERIVRQRQLSNLEQEVATGSAQIAEARRQATEREQQVARLTRDLRSQISLANLKITALASLLEQTPKASAVAVWDPVQQEGVLKVEKLPALRPTQDYQLWVVDPQYPNPVDGGVFSVDPATGEARLVFKARQPVSNISAFAVTLERKGGVPKAEGPFVLLGK
ncbi:MAG: anti-sigma factor [Verrucomicrobia bacterium]|nr:anti-sigma factor [Verrucomicrobiota bacterium]